MRKSSLGASGYKAGVKMGGEIWVWGCVNWSIHSSEQSEPMEGVGLFIALNFQRAYHQSGSSLRSFFFCNQLGYGAVTSLTFHLRFCFCFRSHLKRQVMFFLLSSTSTRQLMPFKAQGEEHRRQLTAHPGISLLLV